MDESEPRSGRRPMTLRQQYEELLILRLLVLNTMQRKLMK